jgi:hypothetical protein
MTPRLMRLPVALMIAAPIATAPLLAQGLEYAAGTTRYRVSTTTSGTQSSPMGNASFQVGLKQQISVNLMKHAKDTVMATITLDSIALKSSGPEIDVSKLVGAKFVSYIAPTGKFYSGKSPDGLDPQLAQITEGVVRFLPVYRGNVSPGMSWADTLSGKVSQQGMDLDRTAVTNYKVEGDTTIGGEKALKIQRDTKVKAAGSGSMNGQPVAMESVSNSSGSFFLTRKGVYLGSTSNDDVNVKITIVAQNAEINLKQTAQTKVEAIFQ